VPLAWLALICTWGALEKAFSPNPQVGFLAGAADLAATLAAGALPPDKAAVAPQLILGQRIDAALAVIFAALLWVVIADTLRVAWRSTRGRPVPPLSESPYIPAQAAAAHAR
jgi:carbon starvation protein